MPFCLLYSPEVDAYRERIRDALRAESFPISLGILIVLIGLGAFALLLIRKNRKDTALGWFSAFALLYGFRLLIDTEIVPFALRLTEQSTLFTLAVLTYLIPIPALFFGRVVFPQWRPVLRWAIPITAAFAAIAIAADFLTGKPFTLHLANNVLVLAIWGTFSIAVFRRSNAVGSLPVLRWGVILFGLTLVLANLRGLGMAPLGFNPEPLGFFCLLVALSVWLARRTIAHEDLLLAISKELEIATRIQLSILPREMPRLPHLAITAAYRPMTAVAGDFYEFLQVDERRIGVLVADVSGHGVPAALIASMVKVAISAQQPHAADPARVLSGMNTILAGKLQGQFVSAAYLFLDFAEGIWRYSAAGHPPLLWWRHQENRAEAVEENGLLLGIFAAAAYTATEHPLHPGDRFLLYTDGLIEAANASGEFFGDQRLRAHWSGPGDCTADALLGHLDTFAGYDRGRAQDDDLTVIALQVVA